MKKAILVLVCVFLSLTVRGQLSPQYIAMEQQLHSLRQPADVGEYDAVMSYVDNQLDFTLLATSPQWESTIRLWVAAHETLSPSQEVFEVQLARAAKKVIERTLPDIGTAERLVRTLAPLADSLGVSRIMPYLAATCNGMDIPLGETSALANRMFTAIRLINSNAPLLANREYDALQNCLLLFFDSGSDSCRQIINQLMANYPALQQNGIRVVSIAADLSFENIKANCANLPWDNFCIYTGFNGTNFINYGVSSVPTLYYIDFEGTVRCKYYNIQDVEKVISQLTKENK